MLRVFSISFLLCLLLAGPCWAQAEAQSTDVEEEPLELFDDDVELIDEGWSQLSVSAGYMWLKADGRFALRLPSGKHVTILDLDRIGVDERDTSAWFTVNWRSRHSRWGAWFGAWRYDTLGFRVWEDELVIDDEVIVPVGAGVATDLRTDWYIIEATYSIWQNEKVDAGLGFGLHMIDLDTRLAGKAVIGEAEEDFVNTRYDFLAPLPNVLSYLHWRVSDKWTFTSRLGWFGLSYDKYRGKMTNLHALIRYSLTDRWSVETGYQFVKLDLDIKEENYTSIYDVDFSGPLAVLRFNF